MGDRRVRRARGEGPAPAAALPHGRARLARARARLLRGARRRAAGARLHARAGRQRRAARAAGRPARGDAVPPRARSRRRVAARRRGSAARAGRDRGRARPRLRRAGPRAGPRAQHHRGRDRARRPPRRRALREGLLRHDADALVVDGEERHGGARRDRDRRRPPRPARARAGAGVGGRRRSAPRDHARPAAAHVERHRLRRGLHEPRVGRLDDALHATRRRRLRGGSPARGPARHDLELLERHQQRRRAHPARPAPGRSRRAGALRARTALRPRRHEQRLLRARRDRHLHRLLVRLHDRARLGALRRAAPQRRRVGRPPPPARRLGRLRDDPDAEIAEGQLRRALVAQRRRAGRSEAAASGRSCRPTPSPRGVTAGST